MKKALLASLALLLTTPALAISEKGYFDSFEHTVLPFYRASGVTGSFAGARGVQISYRKFEVPNEKGAIVFVPGRGESYLTYPELEYDLTRAGYSVYVIDPRSQGFSGRVVTTSRTVTLGGVPVRVRDLVTVESFDFYVDDLKTFIDTVVTSKPHPHLFMLTNSMGGPIGAFYLAANPGIFERAVMSVPMFEINTHAFPEGVGLEVARIEVALGFGDHFASLGGEKPYNFAPHYDCASANGHDARRCEIDRLVFANPSTASGGSSYRWVVQSMDALIRIRKTGLARKVDLPILMFQAGADQVVRPGGENVFCGLAPHCELAFFPSSTHELLTERDELRAPALAKILSFFAP